MGKQILLSSLTLLLSFNCLALPDLDGVWILNGPGSESEIILTARGQAIQSDYDLLQDDPSLFCVPASVARVWANPNSRIKIEQFEDRILISYELFDLRREIPIGDASDLSATPSTTNLNGTRFAEMGSSFAWYEDGRLLIESRNHTPGYIRTSRGIPQSTNTVAIEELTMSDDILHITHTYIDDTIFVQPLVLEYTFRALELGDVERYDCTDANYDWFLELNADDEEDSQ